MMPVPGWDVPNDYYAPDEDAVEEAKLCTCGAVGQRENHAEWCAAAKQFNWNYLDRLKAEVDFATNHGKLDREPVTDSSLTYGDLRVILMELLELHIKA